MEVTMKVTDSNVSVHVNGTEKQKELIKNKLHALVDVYDSNRFHDQRFTRWHSWDGKTNMVGDLDHIQPGLKDKVHEALYRITTELGCEFKVDDDRTKDLGVTIPPEIKMEGKDKRTLILNPDNKFSYQYNTVKTAFEKSPVGVVNLATNAGKSAIMYSVLKYSLESGKLNKGQFLVIAPNVSVAAQLKGNIEAYLGIPTGLIGDGNYEISKQIVVSTIQSLGSRTKKPKPELKTPKQKETKRMVDYWNRIKDVPNTRQALGMLIKTFRPKYKYEQKDLENLKHIYKTVKNDAVLKIYFNKYEADMDKMLSKKDKKSLDAYYEMTNFLNNVTVVLADEIQTAASDSYSRTFSFLTNTIIRLGFTGTIPTAAERELKIRSLFGSDIAFIKNKDLIEKGVSTKCYIKLLDFDYPRNLEETVERELVIQRVPKYQQSLKRYQLAYDKGIVNNQIRNQLIAKLAKKLALVEKEKGSGLGTLILVNSVEHGDNIVKELDELNLTNDIGYEFLKGADTQEEREAALERLGSGETQILIGTQILDAGIDVPFVKNIIYVSSGSSFVQTLQRIGRALRIKEGKDKAVIYDIIDRQHPMLYKHSKQRIKYYKDEHFEFVK